MGCSYGGDTGEVIAGNGLLVLVLSDVLLVGGVGCGTGLVGAAGGGVQTSCWVLKEQAPVWGLVLLVACRIVVALLLHGVGVCCCGGWFGLAVV